MPTSMRRWCLFIPPVRGPRPSGAGRSDPRGALVLLISCPACPFPQAHPTHHRPWAVGCRQPGVTLAGQLAFQLLFRLKSTVGCPSSWKVASPGMNFFLGGGALI